MKKIDLVGQKFGRLTVVEQGINRGKHILWQCVCECGAENIQVEGYDLRQGHTQSCGCYQQEQTSKAKKTHGMRHSKEYSTWSKMWGRCTNEVVERYPNYGGRGIKICDRWKRFEEFYADMGPCPDGFSIERINNDGDYEPTNCVWADAFTQAKNRRKRVDNKSGCPGVFWYPFKGINKWVASITRNKETTRLGYFDQLEDAIAARKAAEQVLDLRSLSDTSAEVRLSA